MMDILPMLEFSEQYPDRTLSCPETGNDPSLVTIEKTEIIRVILRREGWVLLKIEGRKKLNGNN
jgi:hypothetical protein